MAFRTLVLAALVTAQVLIYPSLAARAETLTWHFRSEHPNVVSLEFYSEHRRGHSWPGNKKVYVLDDYNERSFRLSCRSGEKICYGAWVRNRQRTYWGVGYNNRNRCRNCCYTCSGGETRLIVLNP